MLQPHWQGHRHAITPTAQVLSNIGIELTEGQTALDGTVRIDLATAREDSSSGGGLAVLRLGPRQHSRSAPFLLQGSVLLQRRLLQMEGWRVVALPWYQWAVLHSGEDRLIHMYTQLQAAGVEVV